MDIRLTIFIAGIGLIATWPAHGQPIWFSYHEASGSGTANVFDGGSPMSDSGSTLDPMDPDMGFGAFDSTHPGSYGAVAIASGESRITPYDENAMSVHVELHAGYYPSLFPGGDNPGGMAEGELSSVIEFIMPFDEIGEI